MGGFKLVGKNYVVHSTAPVVCYCMGYVGPIDDQTENDLLKKRVQVLDPYTDLPPQQRGHFLAHHMPDDMSYAVRSREIDDEIREPETPPLDVSGTEGWGSQFATIN